MPVENQVAPVDNEQGGYRYLPSLRFASGSVLSLPGMAIEHAVLSRPLLLADGFAAIGRHLERVGRPKAALCGIELRSPAQLSFEAFRTFNDEYLSHLAAWDLIRDGAPSLTRTNVAPYANAPQAPSVLAFSYTVEEERAAPCFVVSGVAELPMGRRYPDEIVRRGETSPEALTEKARTVVEEIAENLALLGGTWDDAVSVHLYSLHALAFELQREVLAAIGVVPVQGIVWHDVAPPVAGLELEVDVRRYAREHVIEV